MKIVLFVDWGPNKLTKELKEELNRYPFPLCRANIVDFIKKHGDCIDSRENIYKLENSFYKIEDVDISRPWHIAEYDGKEDIEYLDYDIIDKEMNYCELRE